MIKNRNSSYYISKQIMKLRKFEDSCGRVVKVVKLYVFEFKGLSFSFTSNFLCQGHGIANLNHQYLQVFRSESETHGRR